jgi:hypothetical protein
MIDRLADRIERAFTLRRSQWYRGCSTSRVWSAAALTLWQIHERNPQLPLDPEFFVASQPVFDLFADPWKTLAHADAGLRYQRNIRRITRQLRGELKREIRRAEVLIQDGRGLTRLLRTRDSRFSPLGLYITAHRAGRPDLAETLRHGVLAQHRSCPLYRPATIGLLPLELYPVRDCGCTLGSGGGCVMPREMVSLN